MPVLRRCVYEERVSIYIVLSAWLIRVIHNTIDYVELLNHHGVGVVVRMPGLVKSRVVYVDVV